jgi:hypothetical protein
MCPLPLSAMMEAAAWAVNATSSRLQPAHSGRILSLPASGLIQGSKSRAACAKPRFDKLAAVLEYAQR